jgi:hypothetical protein
MEKPFFTKFGTSVVEILYGVIFLKLPRKSKNLNVKFIAKLREISVAKFSVLLNISAE